jgi:pyruvate kinase
MLPNPVMRTKIVCTLGPSTDDDAVLREMTLAGMDVARLNFSHGTHEDHARRIAQVRRIAAETGAVVAIMGDLQGPKFRLGDLPSEGVPVAAGQAVTLFAGRAYDAAAPMRIPLPHPEIVDALAPGGKLLIDDGVIALRVDARNADGSVAASALNAGALLPRKGLSAVGVKVAVSSITDKDKVDLAFACAQQIEAIALSFVRNSADVRELRELIRGHGSAQLIVSKIEKPEALADLDAIIDASDAVMVARGDLGVEAPPEEVPFYQKRIIRHSRRAGKPVITATQMLQSMIHEIVPTRAEASDVANAVLDGTDAVMLSAETASGAHPVEAVRAMARIARRAEEHAMGRGVWRPEKMAHASGDAIAITESITHSAVLIAQEVGAKAIVCGTRSGQTPRFVARHRPNAPILSLTTTQRALHYSVFMWGVEAFIEPSVTQDVERMFDAAERLVRTRGMAAEGDAIVIVAGLPLGSGAGMTNTIKVRKIGSGS